MSVLGETQIRIFGTYYTFLRVGYRGVAQTITVDQTATAVSVISPSSGGPTATLAATVAGSGTRVITLAAGGSSVGGVVVLCVTGGKSVSSYKPS